MQEVIDEFNERAANVSSFLVLLRQLEQPGVVVTDFNSNTAIPVFGEDSFKVMKASAFLLIYNMVESSIRSAFKHVYEQIEKDSRWFGTVTPKFRELWISQRFREMNLDSASPRNFRELAADLTNAVLEQNTVRLTAKKLPVAGNLNARRIRDVCEMHGVSFDVDPQAHGGVQLETVRQLRNDLAHGHIGFAACGQDHGVSDLIRINEEAILFIQGILENIREFVDQAKYAV